MSNREIKKRLTLLKKRVVTVGDLIESLDGEPRDAIVCVPSFDHKYSPLSRVGSLVSAVQYDGGELSEDADPPDIDEFLEETEAEDLAELITAESGLKGIRTVIYLIGQ